MQGKYFLWTVTSNSLTENDEHDIPSQILKTIFGLHASAFLTQKCMVSSSFLDSFDLKL